MRKGVAGRGVEGATEEVVIGAHMLDAEGTAAGGGGSAGSKDGRKEIVR